jgi:hypothetical protein
MNGAGDAEGPGTMSRQVSYGGGVQSNALLVLAAQGPIDYRTFPFANVGDDSEHSATLRYVRDVAMPYAAGVRPAVVIASCRIPLQAHWPGHAVVGPERSCWYSAAVDSAGSSRSRRSSASACSL